MYKRWRNRKGIYVGMETLIRGLHLRDWSEDWRQDSDDE